jgi:hypothetical protein
MKGKPIPLVTSSMERLSLLMNKAEPILIQAAEQSEQFKDA